MAVVSPAASMLLGFGVDTAGTLVLVPCRPASHRSRHCGQHYVRVCPRTLALTFGAEVRVGVATSGAWAVASLWPCS